MTRKLYILLLLTLWTSFCYGQKEEEQLIRETFENYKSAILQDKGNKAVNFVDSRTIEYYSKILDLVKNADSAQVDALPILDKLMVFSVRHRTPKADILKFDGKELLVYAIKNGMVGKNSVVNTYIGEISISNDFAKGQLLSNGESSPIFFHFYKESGDWKIDLTSVFPISTIAFRKMLENNGQNENDYLFLMLEMLTDKKPGQEIWEKVR
jgi:hypothetical protein